MAAHGKEITRKEFENNYSKYGDTLDIFERACFNCPYVKYYSSPPIDGAENYEMVCVKRSKLGKVVYSWRKYTYIDCPLGDEDREKIMHIVQLEKFIERIKDNIEHCEASINKKSEYLANAKALLKENEEKLKELKEGNINE